MEQATQKIINAAKHFDAFLVQSGCKELFMHNWTQAAPVYHKQVESLESFLTQTTPQMLVKSAFVFSETEQGIEYWNDFSDKWVEYFSGCE